MVKDNINHDKVEEKQVESMVFISVELNNKKM